MSAWMELSILVAVAALLGIAVFAILLRLMKMEDKDE